MPMASYFCHIALDFHWGGEKGDFCNLWYRENRTSRSFIFEIVKFLFDIVLRIQISISSRIAYLFLIRF